MAYRHSRLMFLGDEDGFPAPQDDLNIPQNANALLQLLCVAYTDAYEKGNPVVLALKQEQVLLGRKIEAVEKKRYGNCIIYDDSRGDCQAVIEQTVETAQEKSMLQMFGEARLFYFPTPIPAMWTKLRSNVTLNVDQASKVMDEYDPDKEMRRLIQKETGIKK
ncbi:hypothetical protein COOONC_25891 [Cooperia oncophora]